MTGPDEYTAAANNNIFTNLAAQQNLRDAVAACRRRPDIATQLGVDAAELAIWLRCADRMHIPYDEARGVHQQSDEFTHLAPWDFEGSVDHYPLLLNYPYYDLYRKQVVKQSDLVLAMYLRGDAFTPEQKLRNFDYYEPLTVRDSSLSACCQALIAAEVGYLDLAYDYLVETFSPTCTICMTMSAADCISRPWPARGSTVSPDSAACVITAANSPSRHGSPAN